MARVAGPPQAHAAHDAQRQHRHGGQDHRVHADPLVQRQHGGAGNHVGRGAVTVQRHQQRQQGRADGDLDRVAVYPFEDLADQRVEQASVDHQAEEQDGKQQQRGRRCDHFQPIEHHLAQVWREAANQGENNRNDSQCNDRGQAFTHDQVGESHHHDQAQECEHGLFSCFYCLCGHLQRRRPPTPPGSAWWGPCQKGEGVGVQPWRRGSATQSADSTTGLATGSPFRRL